MSYYPAPRMREAGVMWSGLSVLFIYLSLHKTVNLYLFMATEKL